MAGDDAARAVGEAVSGTQSHSSDTPESPYFGAALRRICPLVRLPACWLLGGRPSGSPPLFTAVVACPGTGLLGNPIELFLNHPSGKDGTAPARLFQKHELHPTTTRQQSPQWADERHAKSREWHRTGTVDFYCRLLSADFAGGKVDFSRILPRSVEVVAGGGIEPPTQGFSVLCSTN